MSDLISVNDLFLIFDKPLESTRWIASADSEEYLGIVSYLMWRNNRELAA